MNKFSFGVQDHPSSGASQQRQRGQDQNSMGSGSVNFSKLPESIVTEDIETKSHPVPSASKRQNKSTSYGATFSGKTT